uniref:cytochrome P450 2J3-like n=1 Tax=Styela clava TaxID=7725 RepID=UPI00193A4ED0|nr:cytochrome P450 2J3-like [Styela clava]
MSWVLGLNFATLTIGMATILLLYYMLKRPKNFPPGPHGLPIIGYVPFMGKNPAVHLQKIWRKYGSVMSVQFGREFWVILNDYQVINQALAKQGKKFSGRPQNFVFDLITEQRGIGFADYGPTWKDFHKFGLMTLRGYGVGKKGVEENIIEESHLLIENLTINNSQDLQMKLTLAISNNISRVVFGSRFDYENRRLIHMIEILRKLKKSNFLFIFFFTIYSSEDCYEANMLALITLAPMLRFIPPFSGVVKLISSERKIMMGYLQDIIEEHESTFDEHHLRDFTDAFLKEIKNANNKNSSFNKLQLVHFIRDLFEAGSSTSSSTMSWAFLCFAHYAEFQEKIAGEISKTLGENGIPLMKHRDELPFTCAFIQELMRHRTLVPLGVFHKTNEDAILHGYTIPKNTTICPNLWAVHHDSQHFENPEEFRPERFLDRDGKFIQSNYVIPFSVGPRRCIGEQLARMQIFLLIAGIVQKLRIVPDPDNPLPSFCDGGSSMLIYEPPNFEVLFEKR